jgi:hypothetical protein
MAVIRPNLDLSLFESTIQASTASQLSPWLCAAIPL